MGTKPPPAPTPDDFTARARIETYRRYQEELNCTHPEVIFTSSEPPTCSACKRTVKLLSDIQVDQQRED